MGCWPRLPLFWSRGRLPRMRFSAFLFFTILWTTFVYAPLVHSVWGGGWIGSFLGALDFGGGLVVCVSAGLAGFTAARVVGPRRGWGSTRFLRTAGRWQSWAPPFSGSGGSGSRPGAPTRPAVSRPTPWLSPSCRPGPPVFAGRAWSGSTGEGDGPRGRIRLPRGPRRDHVRGGICPCLVIPRDRNRGRIALLRGCPAHASPVDG